MVIGFVGGDDYAFLKLDDIHENEPRNIANSNAPAQIDEVISPERSVSPQPGCSTWDLPRTPPRSGGFVQQPEINREIAENNNSQITPGKMLDQISPIPSTEVVKKNTKRSRNIAVILNTTGTIQSLKLRKQQGQKTKERKEKSQKLRMKRPLKRRKYESESSDKTEGEIHLDDEEEVSDENEAVCVGCEEPYLLTKKSVDWIQCIICNRWLHDDCTSFLNICEPSGRLTARKK
ncbi:unnamed protein product [Acanthoscelides obtectus]|uniref:Uncharacterized protein n=1 Tax=Acanthoscelides obtectus TaxID=200917 RepID=A0A9P0LGZ9_ACAOB|nr:unnamed protein product [Acanthoscelides obtectus]CAK1675228.1 hypothetical protein AOBTE_LOCUS30069 [Acanthoscelides obtectus]